jgi:hypothetical protein
MQSVDVPSSVHDSKKLQSFIDSIGDVPSKYIFSPDHEIEIISLLKVFNFTEWDGQGCLFNLMENAPVSIFGEQIPLISPKYPASAEGLIFHDFRMDGRRDCQNKVPLKNGKNWGLGYHNFFTLGRISGVSYSNSKNCTFYNLELNNNLGDGIRVEGGQGIKIYNLKGEKAGHDFVCLAGVNGADVSGLIVTTAVNSAVRTRSTINANIHDNYLFGDTGLAYAPIIQLQDTNNWDSSVNVFNNTIIGSWGPGIQVVGDNNTNGIIHIHHNLFKDCGKMPAANKLPTTGAIVFDGHSVEIDNNTIIGSHGYGISAGDFNLASTYSYTAKISRNIVVGTRKANYPGTASGTGIANLLGSRYSISCSENCLWDNLSDLYKITQSKGIMEDPLFIGNGNYHLQDSSPCRKEEYQIGCYTDELTQTELLIKCKEKDLENITSSISQSYSYSVYKE